MCFIETYGFYKACRQSDAKRPYTVEELHLCTFKTPTCRRFMSAKVGSLCAFEMRKGVKRTVVGAQRVPPESFHKARSPCGPAL